MTERRRAGATRGGRSSVPPHPAHVIARMFQHGLLLVPLVALALACGMAIYHFVEGLAWSDAFLNAAMLLGGMGPVNPLHTTAGKWLAGSYALFAGLVFLVVAGVMLSPVVHHLLGRLVDDADTTNS